MDPAKTNWQTLVETHGGRGFFPRKDAAEIVSEEELQHLIHLGLVLEIGSCLEVPASKLAS